MGLSLSCSTAVAQFIVPELMSRGTYNKLMDAQLYLRSTVLACGCLLSHG